MPEQHQQATDVEKLVGELEIGVDRLRSLYEQYFMGIEKLEPLVPRKDVDRRIHLLRKEQIRNTALRFRFQMILQRYNTYQTHWQRICREIENGTYKRHVARANKRFAPAEQERHSTPPPPPSRQPSTPAPPEAVAPVAGGARPAPVPPPVLAAPKPAPVPLRAPPVTPAGFPQPGAAPSAELAAELADLEQEFGPLIRGGPVRPVAQAPAPRAPAGAGAPAGAPPPRPAIARPAVPPAGVAGPPAARPAPPPVPGPRAQPAPAAPPRQAPAGGAAAAPAPAPRAPAPAPAASPPAPKPAPVAPPAAATPAAAPAGDLSEQRVRALYQQYVDAKRRQNESTAAITYEGIARSIRDSSAKLREKHGKSVDFEVAVRDGKAILKPVIK